jgi:hypothetical protein
MHISICIHLYAYAYAHKRISEYRYILYSNAGSTYGDDTNDDSKSMQAEKYEDEFGNVDIEKEALDEALSGNVRQMILITVEDSGMKIHHFICTCIDFLYIYIMVPSICKTKHFKSQII